MSERNRELLRFYEEKRIKDQLGFYTGRLEQFDRATGQGLFISATILGFASAAGAMAAYIALYAFDQQSKIYGDVVRAVRAVSRPTPDPDVAPDGGNPDAKVADLVNRVEQALRQEQSQWGQLTSQIHVGDQTRG